MAIETPFAKKVPRFQDSDDCFLAPLRNDGELDPALLYAKNCVRNVTLRKNNLILLIFRYCFSIAHFREKYLWIECRLLPAHKGAPSPNEVSQVRRSVVSSSRNEYPAGVMLTRFIS
jgi:hypothetical protein